MSECHTVAPVMAPPYAATGRRLVAILREAFNRTMKDSDFLAEAKRAGWEIRPTSGEDLQVLAKEVIDQPPEVIEWLKKLLAK